MAVCPEEEIILGGDINSFLAPDEKFASKFYMFPDNESILTTVKKRTMTQGQYHKGDKTIK